MEIIINVFQLRAKFISKNRYFRNSEIRNANIHLNAFMNSADSKMFNRMPQDNT